MMAIVDARTGKVYDPPFTGAGSELYVPMDPLSDREIDSSVIAVSWFFGMAVKRREANAAFTF